MREAFRLASDRLGQIVEDAASEVYLFSVEDFTFTLANRYEGDMVVNHLDAYRIEQFGDAEDLAIPELLEDGVTLVEWGNNILPALPADRLEVRILLADDDDERRIEFVAIGERWGSRLAELARRLVPWGATC